jgi:type IV pilus assembly protein PilQ
MLDIKAKKNELSNRRDNIGTPGIITREASTQMLVRDGDTAVMGGIYRRTAAKNLNYVPILGRIPVLGWLFKKQSRNDSREELLIFVSPRIINRDSSAVTGG